MTVVRFTCNGEPVQVTVRDDERLLETLRRRLQLTSLKDGCHPQGQCGACVAIVNGHARVTCTEPTLAVDGGEVITLEGLHPNDRAQIIAAFESAAAGQCGFCLPAIALHAHSYLQKHPNPTPTEIARQLDQHLCRCGGYSRIVEAILKLAQMRRDPDSVIPTQYLRAASTTPTHIGGVGAPVLRLDASDLIVGKRTFTADIDRPALLHAALVLSAHARAQVLSIRTDKAAALPGVVRVVTAADVPGERWQGLLEHDWPVFVAPGEEVRCAGDVLAAVAAESEDIAREAAELVEVDYQVLPTVVSPTDALANNAPRVNPKSPMVESTISPSNSPNLLSLTLIHRGNPQEALAASAHVATGTFHTQRIEHLFLETECCVAEMRGEHLHVWSQGQGIFDDQRQIASILNMPLQNVHITLVPPGGAFGGKEDLLIQGQTALLAKLTGRPVRLALRRDESVRMHPKRHPVTSHIQVGCDAQGRLTAVIADILGDSGAYASVGAKVLERAAGHACGPYRVPNTHVEARAVYTNNPPSGAMRGFGVPQITFALESCIDQLAAKVGIDRWEMRYKNAVSPGDELTTGQRLTSSVGIQKTLLAVKPAYDEARARGAALGIACGIKNSGLGNGAEEVGKAELVVESPTRISLRCGFTEMGQGLWTVLCQIAAERSGLPVQLFTPELTTDSPLSCGQTTASRAVLLGGNAVIAAAGQLKQALDSGQTLGDLVGRVYTGNITLLPTTPIGLNVPSPRTHTTYGFATQLVILDEQGHLAKVVAAHDVGRAINPALCQAQVEGAVVMGLGYALTESLPCENGIPTTAWIRELGALRARDVPEIEVILVEDPEPEGPFGAKGVGEIGLVPTAAAVASALTAFDGEVRTELPMRSSPAAKVMHVGQIHAHHPPVSHGHNQPHAHPHVHHSRSHK
ncbi:MAG: selenium-dependent xanthine dehydrogenase [Polyangiaceae bacterium]|nr:selenium-dependent xanthine dehydrogenase [Polyangiaceae bacterium]